MAGDYEDSHYLSPTPQHHLPLFLKEDTKDQGGSVPWTLTRKCCYSNNSISPWSSIQPVPSKFNQL